MLVSSTPLRLPDYVSLREAISSIALPFSASRLHGIFCAYVSASAHREGEAYLRALTTHDVKDVPALREATFALFGLYTVTQQQVQDHAFEFELLLPDDDTDLSVRAEAFSEWCDGFIEGLLMLGVDVESFDEDVQDAFHDLKEFVTLDCDAIEADEEDERAFMQICEHARVTVLHIYSLLVKGQYETAH